MESLLKQENERGKTTKSLPLKLRNLKYSQNLLSKKMNALKSKLEDSIGEEIDEEQIANKRKYKRSDSESSFMAEVLARSVLHAHNSLSCILEGKHGSQEEENRQASNQDVLVKTVSEPTMLSEDSSSEEQFSSTDSTTSEDEEDGSFDSKNSEIALDTISNIIKDVERLQLKQKQRLLKQYSLPTLELNRTLSEGRILESVDSSETSIQEQLLESFPDDLAQNTSEENNKVTKKPVFELLDDRDEELEEEEKPEFHGMIPEAMKNVKIKEKGLIKTAMQAMLLDTASLMGTYTPPTSPSFKTPEFPKITVTQSKNQFLRQPRMPKSASSVSFKEYIKRNETVLGVPFTEIVSYECYRRRISQPCLTNTELLLTPTNSDQLIRANCFSDNQLNRPLVKTMLNESLQKKTSKRFHIFGSKKSTASLNVQVPRVRSYSASSDKKPRGSFLSRIFSQRKMRQSSNSLHLSNSPSQNELTSTNLSTLSNDLPLNIKTEGNICSNTKHACITPNRHIMSPQQDQTGSNFQQSIEQRRGDQSPSRLNVFAQRRSSDSDLSMTPKGNYNFGIIMLVNLIEHYLV